MPNSDDNPFVNAGVVPRSRKPIPVVTNENPFDSGVKDDFFSGSNVRELNSHTSFAPSDYPYVTGANPFGNLGSLEQSNANNQPSSDKVARGFKQLAANAVSSLGQSLASTFDMVAAANTAKGFIKGTDDDFNSHFMGVSSQDMMDWATNIQKNNPIYEKDPGSFAPGDLGWWMGQMAPQLGTLVGTGVGALATTAAIEASTEGMGTSVAIANLANKIKSIWGTSEAADIIGGGINLAKGMRSSAAMYATIARYSEARFEAQNNYRNTYEKLSQMTKPDGTPYTEEEKQHLASEGAKRDFGLTIAQLPLDILAMRAMVFNPITGTAEGGLEKGLKGIADSFGTSSLGKAAGWATTHGIGAGIESLEAGAIPIFQAEGEHHAMVLAGQEKDDTDLLERVGKDMSTPEFKNMLASGFLGSLIIGPSFKGVQNLINSNKVAAFNERYDDYLRNVTSIHDATANKIKDLDAQGKTDEAFASRRFLNSTRALDGLFLDSQANKSDIYNAHINNLKSTLDQVNQGNYDSIKDLYGNVTPEQVDQVKNEFQTYIDDSERMKDSFNKVASRYTRNFVPQITRQHYNLNTWMAEQAQNEAKINSIKSTLDQYNNLSLQGKQKYNSEYQLFALKTQNQKLSELYNQAKTDTEKANINNLIEQNQQKQTDVSNNLDEIENSDTYDPKVRETDNDIIKSSMDNKNVAYQTAMFKREAYNDAIALQRKRLSQWNDPKFMQEQREKAIENARTEDQLRTLVGKATKEAIQNKQDEINAKNIVEAEEANKPPVVPQGVDPKNVEPDLEIQQPKESIQQPVGSQSLFDTSVLDELVPKISNTAKPKLKETPELQEDPANVDHNKLNDEDRSKLKNAVQAMADRVKPNATFEDLVKALIQDKGVNYVDKVWGTLQHGWELNGKTADFSDIYNKLITNPLDIFNQIHEKEISDIKESDQIGNEESNKKTEKVVTDKSGIPAGFDNNNQVILSGVVNYTNPVTSNSQPKVAKSPRAANLIKTINDKGDVTISYEYTSDELREGDFINPFKLSDPDNYQPGTQLDARVPENVDEIPIPIFENGSKVRNITWGEWKKQNPKLKQGDKEYDSKIPIVIYDKGAKDTDKGLGFVHDIGWYHEDRFNVNSPVEMQQAIDNTLEVRRVILNSGNKATLEITENRPTTFDPFKTKFTTVDNRKVYEYIPFSEANPDVIFAVGKDSSNLTTNKSDIFNENENVILRDTEKNPFGQGLVYALYRAGIKDGKKSWYAMEVAPQPISKETQITIFQALKVYANQRNPDTNVRKLHDKIHDDVLKTTKLDLYNITDAQNFIRLYIDNLRFRGKVDNVDTALAMIPVLSKEKVAKGGTPITNYISFLSGGNILFGNAGTTVTNFVNNNILDRNKFSSDEAYQNYLKTTFSSEYDKAKGKGGINYFLNNLMKPMINVDTLNGKVKVSILGAYKQNYSIEGSQNNRPVVQIDENGNVSRIANTYRDYIMNQFSTNIRSVNIGTKENPRYVSTDNMVSYKISNKKQAEDAQKIPTAEESTSNLKEGIKEDKKEEDSTKSTEDIQSQIARELKELGIRLRTKDDFQSPSELLLEQRKRIANDLDRISDLNDIEEKTVVDYFTNQAFSLLQDTSSINKDELNSNITDTFKKAVEPLLSIYRDKLNFWVKKLKEVTNPNDINLINNYIYSLREETIRLTNVKNNLTPVVNKVISDIENVNGVKIEHNVEESENNNEIEVNEDTTNEYEQGWGKDSLTIDPKSGVSAAIKIFLRSIPVVDKEGNPVKGVFNLDKFYDSNEIIQVLQTGLANVPANFDKMLAAIKDKFIEYPWKNQLVLKLEGANEEIRNKFTSLMSMSPLRMKFTMIDYVPAIRDKNGNVIKAARFKASAWDTGRGGVANSILKDWKNKFEISDLVYAEKDEEGNLVLNKDKAQILIDQFDKFINKNRLIATEKQMQDWLSKFGIIVSDKTMSDLKTRGLYHNYSTQRWETMGNRNLGLFGILASNLESLIHNPLGSVISPNNPSPLDNTIISTLANLETKYDTTHVPYGGRDNGKSYFAITSRKFITDRALDLKSTDSTVRTQLKQTPFSTNSYLLQLLGDSDIRDKFSVDTMGFTALDILGKKFKGDNSITRLSSLDYETAVNNMFFDMTKGDVQFKDANGIVHKDYPGTSIDMRWATLLAPTMSDKSSAMPMLVPVFNFKNKDLNNGKGISDEVANVLYKQLVKPELERMIKFYSMVKETNIKSYDEGAGIFFLLPSLNNLEIVEGSTLKGVIKHQPDKINIEYIENNKDLMTKIYQAIKDNIDNLKQEKLNFWEDSGVISRDSNNNINSIQYIDDTYINNKQGLKFTGTVDEKANMAALDLVINQAVSLANSFMLFAGDPAMKYKLEDSTKEKEKRTGTIDYVQRVKDTFTNIGKRLANQIAPGISPAESESEKYVQLFINDRKSIADKEFIKFSTKILDGKEITDKEYEKLKQRENIDELSSKYPKSKGFFNIEASDAQEYTTWMEHLNLLNKLGKMPNSIIDVTAQDIQEARDLFSSSKSKKDLSDKDLKLIGKILQPMKPVYTGQQFDADQLVMRDVYIKSSSFPLIPQLTEGFEIDKLRVAMEKLNNDNRYKGMGVRASYQSANKVGAMKNALDIWDNEGRIKDGSLDNIIISDVNNSKEDNLKANGLVLDRKNFRIQQEVPYKSSKVGFDLVSYGTQLMKLAFGNDVMNFDGFKYQGKTLNGVQLQKEFTDLHLNLFKSKQNQLFDELGLDKNGIPIDKNKSTKKLQKLLIREADARGLPTQSIKGLEFRKDSNGNITNEFVLPIWSNINSDKFEALMNSIVTNRIAKLKFPGSSYVAGSPEGFKMQTNLEGVNVSKMIFTPSWNGSELQATHYIDENGNIVVKKAQVFVTSKFKDNSGKLVDLFEDFNKESKEGKYVTQDDRGMYHIKTNMFDKSLFNLMSFRIPTTGLGSGSAIEIVGFLPAQQGDLMVLPSIFTKIKGLDFDVDKENTYQYFHYHNKDGKFEKLDSKHKTEILDKAFGEKIGNTPLDVLANEKAGEYTNEEIDSEYNARKANAEFEDRLIQNKLVEIYNSIYSNPDEKLQAKINSILNTDYSEEQANIIEEATPKNDSYWTPLSGEYQKKKLMIGATGAIGKGAYSMDVTFHSQAQQSKTLGKPLKLQWVDSVGNIHDKVWEFGNITTKADLGNSTTLDNGRTISQLLDETAQYGVDNEKLQIMGRVNFNTETLDAQKVFNLLGLDKGNDGGSISMRFMSQPILREYVERMSNAKSSIGRLSTFKTNEEIEIEVKQELLKKYYSDIFKEDFDYPKFSKDTSARMTTSNMLEAIKDNGTKDGELQAAILLRFLDMKRYGMAIRSIQTGLNVESKGLGKSFFNTIDKKDFLSRLDVSTPLIDNLDSLVGEFIDKPQTASEVKTLLEQGYYVMGDRMIRPNTIVGAANVIAVSSAYNLWNKYLPYDSVTVNNIFTELLGDAATGTPGIILDENNTNNSKSIELKQKIFSELKKYIATYKEAGMFGENETANNLRKELYIDSVENTSLAKYMQQLMQINGNENVDTYIKNNPLLSRFEYLLKKDGQPSLIQFNNTKGDSFNESYIYNGFASLFEPIGKNGDIKLPKIGNKEYTLSQLGQALGSYSMLGNAKQEAIQFTKYISVSYLNEIGYSSTMRSIDNILDTNRGNTEFNIKQRGDDSLHNVSPFTIHFTQHYPELIKNKFQLDSFTDRFKLTDGGYIDSEGGNKTFIAVYNRKVKSNKKFQLYKFDGAKYVEIPLLGTFGMDEYSKGSEIGTSILGRQKSIKIDPQPSVRNNSVLEAPSVDQLDTFHIKSGNVQEVLQSIVDNKLSSVSESAKQLIPFVGALRIQYGTDINGKTGFKGIYDRSTDTITINPDNTNHLSTDKLSQTILEEITHGLTVKQIDKYIIQNKDGSVDVKSNSPTYASDIVRLYNDVRLNSNKDELDNIIRKVRTQEGLSIDELVKYGTTDIYEFIARSFSNKDFQKYLASDKFKMSEQTKLQKFKEFVINVLKSLGLNITDNNPLGQLINSTFELIEKENSPAVDFDEINSQLMWNEATNFENKNTDYTDNDIIGKLSPQDSFPNKQLDIKNEKCK